MIVEKFDIKVDKDRVLNIIDCYKDNPIYSNICKMIDDIEPEFYNRIKSKALFEIKENILVGYEKTVPVIITVGNDISLYSEYFFNSGEYLKGIIINAMADDYLMQMDFFVCSIIIKKCNSYGLGVSSKFVPFEDIDGKYQKVIVQKLDSFEKIGIWVNERNILYPGKVLSFLIGADKNIKNKSIVHDCSKCSRRDCKWRKVNFEVRGSI